MKIAVPLQGDEFSPHFGHSSGFALFEVTPDRRAVVARHDVDAPAHEHGAFPVFLRERGADVVLAGGMGPRAREAFEGSGIEVVVGVPQDVPEALVAAYLSGTLTTGLNACEQ